MSRQDLCFLALNQGIVVDTLEQAAVSPEFSKPSLHQFVFCDNISWNFSIFFRS